jgi:hypothetical protein
MMLASLRFCAGASRGRFRAGRFGAEQRFRQARAMRDRVTRLLGVSAALLCVVMLAGCGTAGSTPEQAVETFYTSLARGDYAGAWQLVSDRQKQSLSSELKSISELAAAERGIAVKRLSAQFGAPLDAAQLASLSAEEFFTTMMSSAFSRNSGKLKTLVGTPHTKPGAVDPNGESAEVPVDFLNITRTRDGKVDERVIDSRVVRCVREGGGWRVQMMQ